MNDMLNRAVALKDEVLKHRRCIHQFAEVGFDLPQTVEYVEKTLISYGYQPSRLGRAGVVATVGRPGKTILLRADMDALPMEEESGLPFAAKNGNCHSCGHDCHAAMLLGAAKLLKEREDELEGTVKLMFQPAEELLSGAKEMIEAGLLRNPAVDAAFALHVMPGFPYSDTGTLNYNLANVTNSGDAIRITIQGKDSHGSQSYLGVDAIHVAAHLVLALEEIVAREVKSQDDIVLLVGKIEGGTTCNSVAGTASLEVSVRTNGAQQRIHVLKRVNEVAHAVAETYRARADVEHMYGSPALINDRELTQELVGYLEELLPEGTVRKMGLMGGGEDFTMVAEQVPTTFMVLGAGSPGEGYPLAVHNPATCFNEAALPVGTAALVYGAVRWLKTHSA